MFRGKRQDIHNHSIIAKEIYLTVSAQVLAILTSMPALRYFRTRTEVIRREAKA
jgi:hypothetical protein